MRCSEASLAAGETLAGTATRAERWLLLEVRSTWGRDVLPESDLPEPVKEHLSRWLAGTPNARVLFVRRPKRWGAATIVAFAVSTAEGGGEAGRLELGAYEDLLDADLGRDGEPVEYPLFLVCTHGRRDACCSRNGVPLYDALRGLVPEDALWQSSHQGGHRFAANLLALPAGISLGRVAAGEAAAVVSALRLGRIPLAHFRGRTFYAPAAQTAEIAVRERFGLTGFADLALEREQAGLVTFAVRGHGSVDVVVEEQPGPPVPQSCGAEPESTSRYSVRW